MVLLPNTPDITAWKLTLRLDIPVVYCLFRQAEP